MHDLFCLTLYVTLIFCLVKQASGEREESLSLKPVPSKSVEVIVRTTWINMIYREKVKSLL